MERTLNFERISKPWCYHLQLLCLLVISARHPWSLTASFILQEAEAHRPRWLRGMEKSQLDLLPHPGQLRSTRHETILHL